MAGAAKENRMIKDRLRKVWIFALSLTIFGCGAIHEPAKKSTMLGLIATPPSYYSTPKGRFLGAKYQGNLDRLIERIARDPKTANLQFANNLASLGGIGFFTHAAAKTSDERYLEVIVGAPEVFESKGGYSAKVARLFSLYGAGLLAILSNDADIYQEKEVSGYGLNFSWRNVLSTTPGSGLTLERAVVYFSKERVRAFLQQQVSPDGLLADATIFAAEQDGPMTLVAYRAQEAMAALGGAPEESHVAAIQSDPSPAIVETSIASSVGDGSKREQPARKASVAPAQAQAAAKGKLSVASRGSEDQEPRPAPVARTAEQPITGKAEVGKTELRASETKSASIAPALPKGAEKTARGQVASLGVKPNELAPEHKAPARASAKTLEGFVIQIAFNEASAGKRWAKTMEDRGFTVSLTETGAEGSVRVRVGNFAAREEAEKQLRGLRQEGLSGIIINLPQAYRPVAGSVSPPSTQDPVSISQ